MSGSDARPTASLRAEHATLRRDAAKLARGASTIAAWSTPRQPDELGELAEFLERRLLPHARAEEAVMYPMMDKVMGADQATATMVYDHAEIHRRAVALTALTTSIGSGPPTTAQAEALREHLYGLWAIIELHLDKEEKVLFALLDERLTPADTRTLLEKMEAFGQR
jgi:iron-sulfur cluster repair protein YtfE (RIC family)